MTRTGWAPGKGGLLAVSLAWLFSTSLDVLPARALEAQSGEEEAIKSCERRVCTALLRKTPKTGDLKCELTKTWARSTIKGAESHTLKWGFGDARCSVQLNVSYASLVAAVTKDEYELTVPPHTVNCSVEQEGEAKPVRIKAAPKIIFKDGKADKIWINLISVDGPGAIKGTVWTAAQLADGLGLFHRKMLKSVNKFIYKRCPKRHPQAVASSSPEAKEKSAKPASPAQSSSPAPAKKENGKEGSAPAAAATPADPAC